MQCECVVITHNMQAYSIYKASFSLTYMYSSCTFFYKIEMKYQLIDYFVSVECQCSTHFVAEAEAN